MRHAIVAAATALGVLLGAATDARANGRFPESNAIFFAPSDPDLVVLRVTFGLMVSRDRGKTWDWLCERAVGLAGIEDPMYTVTPDGTVIASTFMGVAVSHDHMCSWGFAGGALNELVFIDLTTRPAAPGTVVVFASSYAGQEDDGGGVFYKSSLFETTDEGRTWAPLGAPFERTLFGETVDLAASDPDRMYITAERNPGTSSSAFVLTSRDHGKTFVENPLELIRPEQAAFIAAVDPTNADRLYVRTASTKDLPSRLLVSDDAGKTFRTIFTGAGPLRGFALSPDGKQLWVGGPRDGVRYASTTDFVFQQRSTQEIGCLAYAKDGLWACSNERSGFVVGLSTDEGATFQPKMHFCDVRGPLACPAGTSTQIECTLGGTAVNASPPWPSQRALLGCGGGPGAPDGGVTEGGLGDGAVDPLADDRLDASGGCSVRAPSPTPLAGLLAGAAATIALLRRRRRR